MVKLPPEVPEAPPIETDPNTSRACLECDAMYMGRIKCPECGKSSGEPVEYIGGLGVYV